MYPQQVQCYPPGTVFQFPSRWSLKQSWVWSDMKIKDEWGNDVFSAVANRWSMVQKLRFNDLRTGQEIAYIEQKWRVGMPKFRIYVGGVLYAEMKQEFTMLKAKFTIEINNPNVGPLTVSGNWSAFNYVFRRGEREIGVVKRQIAFRDTYTIEIQPGEDVIFILACCIIIDKCTTES